MKKLVLILGFVFSLSFPVFAENAVLSQETEDSNAEPGYNNEEPIIHKPNYTEWPDYVLSAVKKFKETLKTDNPQLIAQNVVYPFSLGWGVPSVQNEQEFIEKYDIILPEYLRQYFIDTPMKHWGSGGNLGGVCLNYCPDAHLTDEGKIIWIKDSEELNKYREEYIAKEKQTIHPSLKNYNYNLYTMETKDWLIRIDDMEGLYEISTQIDIPNIYRFAAWKKGKTISDEPDIVIDQGHTEKDPEFRYSPEYYMFNNSEYHAIFTNDPIGPMDHIPYYIEIYKNFCSETPIMIMK
ncbi:MAG: hypothetical protein IKN67_00095 [Alphaproteobacteria bacterium]|nr:hypothetical protein [Alphaproteobacteria bacterium]